MKWAPRFKWLMGSACTGLSSTHFAMLFLGLTPLRKFRSHFFATTIFKRINVSEAKLLSHQEVEWTLLRNFRSAAAFPFSPVILSAISAFCLVTHHRIVTFGGSRPPLLIKSTLQHDTVPGLYVAKVTVRRSQEIDVFYIYCSAHRNILWNNQQMRQCAVKFFLCKSTLHVSGGTHAHHQEYNFNFIDSHWYNS